MADTKTNGDTYLKKFHVQLLTEGPQDLHLYDSDGPRAYSSEYFCPTPFVIEHNEIPIQDVRWGGATDIQLSSPRVGVGSNQVHAVSGDLLGRITVEVVLPRIVTTDDAQAPVRWTNGVGFALVESCALLVEGHVVDEVTSEIMDVRHELYEDEQYDGLSHMVMKYPSETDPSLLTDRVRHVFVPLPFFHGKPGFPYIPLCALTMCKLSLRIKFRNLNRLLRVENYNTSNPASEVPLVQMQVLGDSVAVEIGTNYVDYSVGAYYDDASDTRALSHVRASVLVDTIAVSQVERATLMNVDHQFLLRTHDVHELELLPVGRQEYEFNMEEEALFAKAPVAEIVLVVQPVLALDENHTLRYHMFDGVHVEDVRLIVGRTELFAKKGMDTRNGIRLGYVNPYLRYARIPDKDVYVIPTCLYPSEYQPSGIVNFALIPSAKLKVRFTKPVTSKHVVKMFVSKLVPHQIVDGYMSEARMA